MKKFLRSKRFQNEFKELDDACSNKIFIGIEKICLCFGKQRDMDFVFVKTNFTEAHKIWALSHYNLINWKYNFGRPKAAVC